MEIIPAIDIIDGSCVRLKKGNFSEKTIYHNNPVEVAMFFRNQGFKRLHLVDLDGAKAGKIINDNLLKNIFLKTGLIIDFGGGIKTDMDAECVFQSGASMITVSSIAVKDPITVRRWLKKYGGEKIILSADIHDGKVAVNGWQTVTELGLLEFITSYIDSGIEQVICTDISRDGMLSGPSFKLYRLLRKKFPGLKLIASGGISSVNDVEGLEKIRLNGVIIGKALFETTINIKDLQKFLK